MATPTSDRTTRTTPRLRRLALASGGLALVLLLLAGCGGRDEVESGSSGTETPPDPGMFAGTYTGTFAGDDTGTFEVTVDSAGDVTGTGESDTDGAFTISGSVDGTGAFSGLTSTGATWAGTFDTSGNVSGTWTLDAEEGTFTGST